MDSVTQLKSEVTKYCKSQNINVTECKKDAIHELDLSLFNLYRNIRSSARKNVKINKRHNNFKPQTQSQIRLLHRKGYVFVQCDKGMGLTVDETSHMDEIAYTILEKPIYIQLQQSETYIAAHIVNTLWKFYWAFNNNYGKAFDLKNRFGHWKFYNLLKDARRTGNYPPLSKLRPLRKIHKNPHEWRSIVNLGSHPSNFFQNLLNDELSAYLALFEYKFNFKMVLNNSLRWHSR